MGGKLNSLTDVLKKTLFFFEALTVAELAPMSRKMLERLFPAAGGRKDQPLHQAEQLFYREKDYWRLNLEGNKENDQFYALLLKKRPALKPS